MAFKMKLMEKERQEKGDGPRGKSGNRIGGEINNFIHKSNEEKCRNQDPSKREAT